MDYDPVLDQDEVETRQARDILEIELTQVQFNWGLSLPTNTKTIQFHKTAIEFERQ